MATVSCRLIEMLAVSSTLRGAFKYVYSVCHICAIVFEYCMISWYYAKLVPPVPVQEVRIIRLMFQVYYLGEGEESKQWLQQQGNTPEKLCLAHIKAVASCVVSSYPTVTPIVWDDMLRGISEETLAGVWPLMGWVIFCSVQKSLHKQLNQICWQMKIMKTRNLRIAEIWSIRLESRDI